MINLVKIEGHSRLRKNTSSGAVVNIDNKLYLKSKAMRKAALQNKEEQVILREEIDDIKKDISDIKKYLTLLINNK